MSEDRSKLATKTLLPELPRDVPMPRYKYQRDERGPGPGAAIPEDLKQKAANLLAGLHLMGCASAN
jgi:hypothetical protein